MCRSTGIAKVNGCVTEPETLRFMALANPILPSLPGSGYEKSCRPVIVFSVGLPPAAAKTTQLHVQVAPGPEFAR